jgi:transposase
MLAPFSRRLGTLDRGGVAMDQISTELFSMALGLAKPWSVVKVEFSAQDQKLDLWLDFPAGSTFSCPECALTGCKVHDTSERTWRHLDFFQHQTFLHARLPRVTCPQHGVKTAAVPWARPGSGFTLLMEVYTVLLVQNGMTPTEAGRLLRAHDTRIWRILQHYVGKARQEADFSQVRAVGVDETSRRRGHRYVSIFMDLEQPRVIFATEGKDAATVHAFKDDLEAHGGRADQVQEFCLDMSAAFQKGLQEAFPGAAMTFDQFHLVQLLNKAVDEVRRQEQLDHPELKRTRWVWLKNDWNRTAREAAIFQDLRASRLKTVRATHLKAVFQDICACRDPAEAEAMLKRWYYWATHSRIRPMIRAARTIKRHWAGVVRWFHSRLTNSLLEAYSGLIQSAKRRARGFRSTSYLITMIYMTVGKLDLRLPPLRLAVAHTK